jgi:hypothetical protein
MTALAAARRTYPPVVIDVGTGIDVSIWSQEDVFGRYEVGLENVKGYDWRMDLGPLRKIRLARCLQRSKKASAGVPRNNKVMGHSKA